MPLLRGRDFHTSDRADGEPVAIVNEAFVRRYLQGAQPVGHGLHIDRSRPETVRIVGVVADAKVRTLGEEPRPFLYQPLAQGGETGWTLLARARDPDATLERLRQAVREVDEEVPVRGLRTLVDATSSALLLPRAGATLFGLVGLLGLSLAAVGLYGLVAQLAAQRLPELGVRRALGATTPEIFRLVVWQGLKLAVAGVVAGLGLAVVAAPGLRVVLYGVAPLDPVTFALVPALLLLVAVLAAAPPAFRAARADPQRVLRAE
jgi:predicted lysophospholipase L1 biosynthesis ABC-type transport system permease subunit